MTLINAAKRRLAADYPKDGEVWQYLEHDPAAGKFHQYAILCITESSPHPDRPMPQYFSAKHTETGEILDILYDGRDEFWLWRNDGSLGTTLTEPYVIYKNVLDQSGECWARPLAEFMDGRFIRVKSERHERS